MINNYSSNDECVRNNRNNISIYLLNRVITLTNRNAANNVTGSTRVTLAQIFGDQITAQTETNRNDFRCRISAL